MKHEKGIQEQIVRWMAAKILGEPLAAGEERALGMWLAESEEHVRLFERIRGGEAVREMLRLKAEGYPERMAAAFAARLRWEQRRRRLAWFGRWAGGVAAAVLAGWGAWTLWLQDGAVPGEPAVTAQAIVPGSGKAVLTLADGERIDVLRMEAHGEEQVFINTEGQEVSVPAAEEGAEALPWHTLTVPAGGEFFYELADRTKVWLNSKSELRFPARFAGGEREVYLQGEAFFDVTSDAAQPFVVHLSGGKITVLGTRFNVTDYADEPLSAVLTEGRIGFTSAEGEEVRLQPSDRLEVAGGQMKVEQVDTLLYMSWVNKMFVFDGQTLEEIMRTLARWYDMDFTFASEDLKGIRLSGRLNRYRDIRMLLHTYEQTAGIRFDIQGRHIVVSRE